MTGAAESSYLDNAGVEFGDDAPDEKPDTGEQDSGFLVTDDTGSDEFLRTPPRPRGARAYEAKIKRPLQAWMKVSIHNPNTAPDAAALIAYGQEVAERGGDLAAVNKPFANVVDFICEGTGNPWLSFAAAAGILGAQIVRNHEPTAETEGKALRIPFTKRIIRLRFKIKLGRIRAMTRDPQEIATSVFNDEKNRAQLIKYHGIRIIAESSANGRRQ